MNDQFYDELLNIKTTKEQQGFHESLHYHRYEATPYRGLEKLCKELSFTESDHVIDFGCGKGRLGFYLYHYHRAFVTGIEMSDEYYEDAVQNLHQYKKKYHHRNEIQFKKCLAEEYEIQEQHNCFYFFNPFSIQIFMRVINNILSSIEKAPRPITLIFYYPSDDYVYFLNNHAAFHLTKEIQLPGAYERNEYERFLVYELSY
ncbi:methyltransferase [Priestia koreensis]|uniref:SAM-dependent methyltransferase n=1 Tax=Priestia koreensis TaxID=284581 RepID=A0A0M0KV68_9BACI|nr:methyltransferase [Priestia koreensis]KOO42716.1 SAM-dependent methyltransferase [Priestia koreensis]